MKINPTPPGYTAPVSTPDSRPASTRKSDASSDASAVTLSGLAEQIKGSDTGATVDADRIAAIKSAIQSGQFKINAGAIADRLIDDARSLVQRQSVA